MNIPGFLTTPRNIGGIVAQVTIEEIHHDEVVITEHPVERGAAIADHAFKRPAEVVITAGWSNSDPASGGDPNYVTGIYQQLLALQAQLQLFNVVTGKRSYTNMLMRSLEMVTDVKHETALYVRAHLREVITVSTQTVTVPPAQNQAMPQKTAPILNQGVVQPSASNNFNLGAFGGV